MSEIPTPSDQPRRGNAAGRFGQQPVRLGVVLAIGAAIAFVVWLAVGRSDSDSDSPAAPEAAKAVRISAGGLRTLGGALNRPIFWAGARPNLQYELTRASNGRVWIRYLPKDAQIGERGALYLTVGTYPVTKAFAATRRVAQQASSTRVDVGDDAVAFYAKDRPTNVYLAFKGSDYQIEVFDHDAGAAKKLVASKKIALIPGSKTSAGSAHRSGAVATTPAKLKNLSRSLHQPTYWVGARTGSVKYELTRTSDGSIYVRYLPANAKIGERKTPFLTVGTYKLPDAFKATQQPAAAPDAVKVKVNRGGIAFYSKANPTSVYLAYPGQDYQIEVFDPSASRAHALVSSGHVRQIR
ncbi:MAG: hypothetical protein M3P18_07180 [Actinomycetota bacterium]|nr:hypothetical protein [Actinomycetota bacterium]